MRLYIAGHPSTQRLTRADIVCHPQCIERLLVADVGLDSRSAGAQALYTYKVPQEEDEPGGRWTRVQPGQAFLVPLGPRRAIGFVLSVREVDAGELGFPSSLLKPLGVQVQGLELPTATLELVHEVARQTLTPVPVSLSLAVPPGVKDRLVTKWTLPRSRPGGAEEPLSTPQQEVVRTLHEVGEIADTKSKPVPDGAKRTLRSLVRKRLVNESVAFAQAQERHRLEGLFRLCPDQGKVEAFLTGVGRRRPAQAVTLMRLQGSESASFSVQEIKSLGGVTDQTIKALVQAGLLEEAEASQTPSLPLPVPNPAQQAAIDEVSASIASAKHVEYLLFGVTGSGKTEVYLRCAAEALRAGKQVLYLVPEIALTAQVIAQLRERFGNLVAVMHSNMTPSERLANWHKVRTGECPVVLGPRSAVFAPLANLGLVIVDEEHETSYKQETSPRYQTKRLVSFLAGRFECPVLLGSATPSIEAFHAASEGKLKLLRLPQRAAMAKLPAVEVVNLVELYREKRPSILAPRLVDHVNSALERGEQAILFLNRRAYSPFLLCRDCGHRFECRHCAVSLAFHRRDLKLRCHQCGYQEAAPDRCPQCESDRVSPFGTGTEKVEEAVQAMFEGARVVRLDRDIARRKGALEETLAAFRSRSADILVGTQMVAKGLDFPNVTVVGVVAADVSLNVPDFRSGERTFQLLSQVAGRAGRGASPGVVVIQTMNPENEAVISAQAHDYETFYQSELEQRREAGYPPFTRLVNVLVTGENRHDVLGLSAVAAQKLRVALVGAEVLGPADCPIERLQNLWRRHVLIKLKPDADPAPVQSALADLRAPKARVVVDVDPVSLM